MFKPRALVAPLCLFALLAAVPGFAAEKKLDRTFKVTPGGRLDVVAAAADITVNGGSNDVVVRIVMSGAQGELDKLELSAEQSGNDVKVSVLNNERSLRNIDGRITVQVPAQYNVELNTSGGDLAIERLQGEVRGKTSGGDVRVSALRGPVKVNTSGGSIAATDIQGSLEAQTSGGDIKASNVEGDVQARTSGGNVEVDTVGGAVSAQTSGGNVVARGARGTTQLRTSGGNITAEVAGKLEAKSAAGDIRVQLDGPNQGISASTSAGSIELQLPRGTKAAVDATASGGTVRSDLPTEASQQSSQRLVGKLNGGGETIYARTSGGNVRLVERSR